MYTCTKCGKEVNYFDCWGSDKPLCHSCVDKAFDRANNAPLRTFVGGIVVAFIIIVIVVLCGQISDTRADMIAHPEKYQVTDSQEPEEVPVEIPDGSPVTLTY